MSGNNISIVAELVHDADSCMFLMRQIIYTNVSFKKIQNVVSHLNDEDISVDISLNNIVELDNILHISSICVTAGKA